jgi:hypothetical protein
MRLMVIGRVTLWLIFSMRIANAAVTFPASTVRCEDVDPHNAQFALSLTKMEINTNGSWLDAYRRTLNGYAYFKKQSEISGVPQHPRIRTPSISLPSAHMREWNSDDYSAYLARFTECNSSRTAEVSVAEKIILQRSRFYPFHPYSPPGPVSRDVADALIDQWQNRSAHIC